MPVFSVRVCSLGVAGSDGAVLAGVLSPIRSSRAEPGEEREHLFMILSTDVPRLKENTRVHLLGCGVVMSSAATSSPRTSCLYWLMT